LSDRIRMRFRFGSTLCRSVFGRISEVYRLPLLGNHLLLVGATGAGKSSVLWSIIYQLAPAIADGTVEIWASTPRR
jgi:predicted AAA+ superfamily ATPase